MEKWIANAIEEMKLPSLYHLCRSIFDIKEKVSFIGFKYCNEPPTLEDVRSIFSSFSSAYPGLSEKLGIEKLASYICQCYSAEKTEYVRTEFEIENDNDNKAELVNKLYFREDKDINSIMEALIQVAHEAQRRIENEKCDFLIKAENYLEKYICSTAELSFGDQEALIYLQSRSFKCDTQVRELIQRWRTYAENEIRLYAHGHEIVGDGKAKRIGIKSLSDASDIERWPTSFLRNFWGGHDREEHIIDATMLRTVEWCRIGGFDAWCRRWAKQTADEIAHSGVEQGPEAAVWLFNLCRSDYAIDLLGNTIGTALWAVQIQTENDRKPWTQFDLSQSGIKYEMCTAVAASIVFCAARLGKDLCDSTILSSAEDFLLKSQLGNGSWPFWCSDDQGSIEATALSTHALALSKPRGWEHAVTCASEWLKAQQTQFGYWYESSASGFEVFLTVLVLDALELAKGGDTVSFNLQRCHNVGKDIHLRNYAEPRGSVVMTHIDNRKTFIQGSHVGIIGDVIAQTISDSFNQAVGTADNKDLCSHLGELKHLVESLVKELPPAEAKILARDFADLVQESTSPAPRKKRLEVTAEGLIEAAKKCRQLIVPIAESIKSILELTKCMGSQ